MRLHHGKGLRNLPKFKSAGEMKLPTSPLKFSENLIRQKIKNKQNEEDFDSIFIFDESSLSLSKNSPIVSPAKKKHPNQRI